LIDVERHEDESEDFLGWIRYDNGFEGREEKVTTLENWLSMYISHSRKCSTFFSTFFKARPTRDCLEEVQLS
jgi:hypothetical protein